MPDPIAPPAASSPAEVVALVSLAISDGDLEAALAQYQADAVLQPWVRALQLRGPDAQPGAEAVADSLVQLMELRLPVSVRVREVLRAGAIALVLSERRIAGTGPDCRPVDLGGLGATVTRRLSDGSWRIAADAWRLAPAGDELPAADEPAGADDFPRETPWSPGESPGADGEPW